MLCSKVCRWIPSSYSWKNCVLAVAHLCPGPGGCRLSRGRFFSPDICRGRCCTQRTDVPALVMRLCVQLLLTRETTTSSPLYTVKTKQNVANPKIRTSDVVCVINQLEMVIAPLPSLDVATSMWRQALEVRNDCLGRQAREQRDTSAQHFRKRHHPARHCDALRY